MTRTLEILLVSFRGAETNGKDLKAVAFHHFWDTPLHFLKTCFSIESGFSLFLELQKSLLVSFRGAEYNDDSLKVSVPISGVSEEINEKMFIQFCEAQPISAISLKICTPKLLPFLRYPTAFFKTHFCLESGLLSCPELQKSLLVSFQGCLTQWQRFESCSTHCFWDTPLHFLKTCFSLESGFHLFLELQ